MFERYILVAIKSDRFNGDMLFVAQTIALVLLLIFLWTILRWLAGIHGGAPFVLVPNTWLEEALTFAEVNEKDTLIDLGCGTGRILEAAAKRGAHAIGYEFHPLLAWYARHSLHTFGDQVQVIRKDLYAADISKATILTIFGVGSMNPAITLFLQKNLPPNTRIIIFSEPKLPFPILVQRPFFTIYRSP